MRLQLHQVGPAAAEQAWQRYLRPARWSDWSPQIRQVWLDGPDGRRPAGEPDVLVPGATGTVQGPLGATVRFRVDSVREQPDADGAREWSWQVRLGPIQLSLQHSVRPVLPSGCRTDLVIDGPALVVLGYSGLAQLALSRLVRR